MKKLVIVLGAAVVLSLALFGCANSGSGNASSASSSSGAKSEQASSSSAASSSESSASAASKDGGIDVAVEKYGLNLDGPKEWVPMSDDRPLSADELGKLYVEQIKPILAGTMTYDEVVAIFGYEPNLFNPAINAPYISFRWESAESSAKYLGVAFKQDDDGVWRVWGTSKTNISTNS